MERNGTPPLSLTDRQIEVVRLIARGFSMEEIGTELDITPRTAKAHCDVLRHKLGVQLKRQIPESYLAQTGDNPLVAVA